MRQLTFLFMLCFCSVAFSQKPAKVMSTYSCGVWVDYRARDIVYPNVWLLGFLSGGNVFGGLKGNVLESVDRESIFLWMDKFCKDSPLEYIDTGGNLLLRELDAKSVKKK